MAYDRFLIDKRVVDRNIAKGLVDPNEYKRVVESLPDTEQNCVHVSLDGDSGASQAAVSQASSARADTRADTSVDDEADDLDDDDDLDDEDDEDDEDEAESEGEGGAD